MRQQQAFPRTMRRALADLVRFGSLALMKDGSFAASVAHWPECSHDVKSIGALVAEGFGVRHKDGSVCVTAKARTEYEAILAADGVAA